MRRSEMRIGLFGFVVATLVVLSALLVFARYPGVFASGRVYHAVFRSVAGLNPGDEVRYGGLLVGSVGDMHIDPGDPGRIVVEFRVRGRTPIRADTRASITQIGFLGEPYLHLQPGSATSPPLPEGATLASSDNPTFQDAMARLAQFIDRADTVLLGAQQIARSSPLERFDRTLAHVDTLVLLATRSSGPTLARLDTTSVRLNALIQRSDRLVATLDTTMRRAGPGLESAQTEAVQTVRDLRGLVVDLRDALRQEGGVDQLVRNLSITTENLARLTERLDQDPSSLLKRRGKLAKSAGPPVRD